jgi:hypothetical protein
LPNNNWNQQGNLAGVIPFPLIANDSCIDLKFRAGLN